VEHTTFHYVGIGEFRTKGALL